MVDYAKEWQQILAGARYEEAEDQHLHRAEIINAFCAMWKTNPCLKEFATYTQGLVLFPEFLFIMVKY